MSQLRNLARIQVELGRCDHCGQPAAWHSVDGLCDVRRRRSYRGKRAEAFVDLDSGEYLAALPDPEARARVELFRHNAASAAGL